MRALLLVTLVLAGCGVFQHGDPYPANPSGTWDADLTVEAAASGAAAVTVTEALAHVDGAPQLVRGGLLVDDAYGQVWLCGSIAESEPPAPPRCRGGILRIQDRESPVGRPMSDYIASVLATASVQNLHQSGTVRWAEGVTIFGRISAPPADDGEG